jgi:hypothetical protein
MWNDLYNYACRKIFFASFSYCTKQSQAWKVSGKFSFPFIYIFYAVCNYFCYIILPPRSVYRQKKQEVVCMILYIGRVPFSSCAHISISIWFPIEPSAWVHVQFKRACSHHVDARTLRKMCSVWGADAYIHKAGALSLMKLIIGVALVNKTSFFTASGTKGLFLPLQAASAVINPLSLASRPAICAPTTHHALIMLKI